MSEADKDLIKHQHLSRSTENVLRRVYGTVRAPLHSPDDPKPEVLVQHGPPTFNDVEKYRARASKKKTVSNKKQKLLDRKDIDSRRKKATIAFQQAQKLNQEIKNSNKSERAKISMLTTVDEIKELSPEPVSHKIHMSKQNPHTVVLDKMMKHSLSKVGNTYEHKTDLVYDESKEESLDLDYTTAYLEALQDIANARASKKHDAKRKDIRAENRKKRQELKVRQAREDKATLVAYTMTPIQSAHVSRREEWVNSIETRRLVAEHRLSVKAERQEMRKAFDYVKAGQKLAREAYKARKAAKNSVLQTGESYGEQPMSPRSTAALEQAATLQSKSCAYNHQESSPYGDDFSPPPAKTPLRERVTKKGVQFSLDMMTEMTNVATKLEGGMKSMGIPIDNPIFGSIQDLVCGMYLCWANASDSVAVYCLANLVIGRLGFRTLAGRNVAAIPIALGHKLIRSFHAWWFDDIPVIVPQIGEEVIIEKCAVSYFDSLVGPLRFAKDTIDGVRNVACEVAGNDSLNALKDMVVGVAALHMLPKEVAFKVYGLLGRTKTHTFVDSVHFVLRGVSLMLDISISLTSGVPPSLVFRKLIGEDKALKEAVVLMKHYNDDNVRFSDVGQEGIPVRTWIEHANIALAVINIKFSKLPVSRRIYDPIAQLKMSLGMCIEKVSTQWLSVDRLAPLAFILAGPPGSGKSTFMHIMGGAICKAANMPYDKSCIFHRVMSSDYLEGYDPAVHHIMHYSEMGFEKDDLVKQVSPAAGEILSLVDQQMCTANKAFADKGKVPLVPMAVICDSNDIWAGFKRTHKALGAIARRFIRIEPRVLKKYARGSMVDSTKSRGNEMLVWSVTVTMFDADAGGAPLEKTKLNFDTTQKFAKWMVDMCREELQSRARTRDAFSAHAINSFFEDYGASMAAMEVDAEEPQNLPDGEIENWLQYEEKFDVPPEIVLETRESELDVRYQEEKRAESTYVPGSYARSVLEEDPDPDKPFIDILPVGPAPKDDPDWWLNEYRSLNKIPKPPSRPDKQILAALDVLGSAALNFGHRWIVMACMVLLTLLQECEGVVSRFFLLATVTTHFVLLMYHPMVAVFLLLLYLILVPLASTDFIRKRYVSEQFNAVVDNFLDASNDVKSLVRGDEEKKVPSAFATFIRISAAVVTITATMGVATWAFTKFFKGKKSTSGLQVGASAIDFGALSEADKLKVAEAFAQQKALRAPVPIVEEEPSPPIPTTQTHDCESWEKLVGAGKVFNRKKDVGISAWNIIQNPMAPVHTGSADALYKSVMRNARFFKVEVSGTNLHRIGYILGIRGQWAIMNGHTFDGLEMPVTMGIEHAGRGIITDNIVPMLVNREDLVVVSGDVVAIQCPKLNFQDITKHFYGEIPPLGNGYIDGNRTIIIAQKDLEIGDKPITEFSPSGILYSYKYPGNARGCCGLPLVYEFGKGSFIAGIHVAGDEVTFGYAVPILKDELLKAISHSKMLQICEQVLDCVVHDSVPDKSLFRYMDLPGITLIGSSGEPVMVNHKSMVKKTLIHAGDPQAIPDLFRVAFGVEITDKWAPPLMKPKIMFVDGIKEQMPYSRPLRVLDRHQPPMDQQIMERVVDWISDLMISRLEKEEVKLGPLTAEQAINGPDGDDFIRGINLSTAAGFGLKGKKRDHLIRVDEGYDSHWIMSEALRSKVDNIISTVHSTGQIPAEIYNWFLKDEPRKLDKVEKGMTRGVYAGSFPHLIVARMVLGSFFGTMVQHSDLFECSLGIDMHSGASKIGDLHKFSPTIVEADVKDWDTTAPFGAAWMANSVIDRIHTRMGYPEEALPLLRAVLSNFMFPVVHYLGNFIRLSGEKPSGRFGTAESNTWEILCLIAYCYLRDYNKTDLLDGVKLRDFGDDVWASVKFDFLDRFNGVWLQKAFATVGVTLTSSSKAAEMEKYLLFGNSSLLKRNFVYDMIRGFWCARLEVDSIARSLMWTIPSAHVSPSTQLASTMGSAIRECFFYCRRPNFEFFTRGLLRHFLQHYPDCEEIFMLSVPKYDDLMSQFSTPRIALTEGPQSAIQKCLTNWMDYKMDLLTTTVDGSEDTIATTQLIDLKTSLLAELKELEQEIAYNGSPFGIAGAAEIRASNQYQTSEVDRVWMEEAAKRLARVQEINDTVGVIDYTLRKRSMEIQFQSGEIAISTDGPATTLSPSETFVDMAGDTFETAPPKASKRLPNVPDSAYNIGSYLERPVFIGSQVWTASTDIDAMFDVSNVFFADPPVRAKLRNVSLVRGTWVIDVSCAGNMFMAGCAIVVPTLFEDQQASLTAILNAVVSSAANHKQLVKFLSSMPQAQVLDCNKNNLVRFRIPFISPLGNVRVFNNSNSALGTGTYLSDALNMLRLRFSTINQLVTTSATVSNASLVIYAHLEDVELGLPTSSQTVITTQVDERKIAENDERVVGPLERIASSAAHTSAWFTAIPILGDYAKASEIGFSALAAIAALFGWSTPTLNTAPTRMKNMPFQNAANTIGFDTGMRICVDPRQEVSISPALLGQSEDEMCVCKIACQESLLWTYSWAVGGTPVSTPLFSVVVHPRAREVVASGTVSLVQPTWVDFAATPFQYWRGTMRYRLQFVKSPLQKGKLGIVYEPNIAQSTLITGAISLNKQHTKVVDLQEVEDVEFDVEWAFPRPWALNVTDTTAGLMLGNIGSGTANMFEAANGYFSVYALTALQSPNNTGIYINVWVSCSDLQVTVPTDTYIPLKRILFQTDERCIGEPECCVLNPTGSTNADCCEYTFGEQVVSFRALLHRFHQTYSASNVADATTHKSLFLTEAIIPTAPVYGATSTDKSLFAYLRMAYLSWRGGIRKRVRFAGIPTASIDNMTVWLSNPATSQPATSSGTSAAQMANMTWVGGVSFVPTTNGGIEYELPYYSNNLFGWSQTPDPYGSANGSATYSCTTATRGYNVQLDAPPASPLWDVTVETAIAEDFSLMRLCAPAPYGI